MEKGERRPVWPLVVLGISLALLALSVAPGWLTHHRDVGGEGYRALILSLNAWQLRSVPVLSAGVIATLGLGLATVAALAVPRLGAWLLIVAAVPLGLLLACLLPLQHAAHVSSVSVAPGWALLVAIVAVAGAAVLILRGSHPSRRTIVVAVAVVLVAGVGGAALRLVQFEVAEAVGTHWSDGTYTRDAGGAGAQLVLRDGSYGSGSFSGHIEAAGTSVIITGDAACPAARGFYHVRGAGGGDGILWEKVVDTCADGARAEALQGVWLPLEGGGE